MQSELSVTARLPRSFLFFHIPSKWASCSWGKQRFRLSHVRRYSFLVTPRWIGLHILGVVFIAAFLGLGWWQLQRGFSGNIQSFAYALEWPMFAGFVVFFWIKTVYAELHPETRPDSQQSQQPAEQHVGVGGEAVRLVPVSNPVLPAQRAADEPDPAMDAYNEYLAALNASPGS